MNDRWKYQVKTGLPWGIFMTVLNDGQFYFRLICFLLFGVFVLGYSSWKAKTKRETKN
jgi:ABC-type transport system involved in Fe-S cluster assembly fused permease/ATPase subunit